MRGLVAGLVVGGRVVGLGVGLLRCHRSWSRARLRSRYGLRLLALNRYEESQERISPGLDEIQLRSGDVLLVQSTPENLAVLKETNDFLVLDNLIAPDGKMPLNTSGGNLAECYMHGLELQIEAARQVRGESTSQVQDVDVSMVCSGPMVTPVSSCIFGSEATL